MNGFKKFDSRSEINNQSRTSWFMFMGAQLDSPWRQTILSMAESQPAIVNL